MSISLTEHVWFYGFKYLWNVNEEERISNNKYNAL